MKNSKATTQRKGRSQQWIAVTPESSQSKQGVLLMVDVINHFEFPDGDKLLRQARRIAPTLVKLKTLAAARGIPVIYVNDNFGEWRSDARTVLRYCTREEARGRDFVSAVAPSPSDYFVLKPMHSAFYQTPLDALLRYLGHPPLILAGIATNSCIVYTAHDAKMRELSVTVLSDCCAARTRREHNQALEHIERMAGARVMSLETWRRQGR